jgi:2-methylcitrate dehydratase PrpD
MTLANEPLAQTIARSAAAVQFDDLPPAIVEQSKRLIIDAIGVALASTSFPFASNAATALSSLGEGDQPVIGMPIRLGLRDAALMNGLLIHGLDYDDTHLAGVVHVSASALPTALAVATARHRSGRDLLLSYVLGVEVAARIGAAAAGGFHRAGFHPTGVAGAFGAAVAAARLEGATTDQIATAQGFAGSLASGSMEFTTTGAWTKRVHGGWAAACGITAAAFARTGFVSPEHIYEGRDGLFRTHMPDDERADLSVLTRGLGSEWCIPDVAVKVYPSCHFTHSFVDATLALMHAESLTAEDIEHVRCLIHRDAVPVVCEPHERKIHPQTDYEAKFSLPFVVAATLVHGRFTLTELDDHARADARVIGLAERVTYEDDPRSAYPHAYSGEVVLQTRSGRSVRHREQINRGAAGRPIEQRDVIDKFLANADLAGVRDRDATRVIEAVLALDQTPDAERLAVLLSGIRT